MRNNHEIDYKIYGEELQFVEIELDPGETVMGEQGGFMMMDDGMAFVHAGGYIVEKELKPGEILKVDTGCVVAFQPTVDFDIEFIRGIRNWMFGGEGLFFANMRGPGKVWLQSLPISRLASRIIQYSPQFGSRREEGSILGGLGNLLDGDGF
jgi:uncharacterized protein (AIM24 family)